MCIRDSPQGGNAARVSELWQVRGVPFLCAVEFVPMNLDEHEIETLSAEVREKYEALKARGLNLDLTRGKPSSEQLDLSNGLLALPGAGDYTDAAGADVRNYGNLQGIEDIRALWAEVLGIDAANLIAGDSSSLNIMFDLISFAYIFGTNDSPRPWKDEEQVKWLCPVPGYDRHFAISEKFGFEMVTVPMLDDGPDVDAVAELVKDPAVKGMWVVPMFANPSGVTATEDVVRALASVSYTHLTLPTILLV